MFVDICLSILLLEVLFWLSHTGSGRAFNVSLMVGGHPVLDPASLTSDANRIIGVLLTLLQSANNLSGCLTITVVNWWVYISSIYVLICFVVFLIFSSVSTFPVQFCSSWMTSFFWFIDEIKSCKPCGKTLTLIGI